MEESNTKIEGLKKKKDHRSSYYLMLNNITNDLDLLLAEFYDLPFTEQGEPPPAKNKPVRNMSKRPMQCENQSGFGGSSTDGTLTSTDSNVSNRGNDAHNNGTLTSTDSNASSSTRPHNISLQYHPTLWHNRAVEGVEYPGGGQQSPSRSASGSNLRQITVLERLVKTQDIWYLSEVGRSGAVHLLKDRDTGIFIVRKSSRDDIMALSVQFPSGEGSPNIDHYLIEPKPYGQAPAVQVGYQLQGSRRCFEDIPTLIAFYCDNKEDLPHRLVLAPAVMLCKTAQELVALNMLGQDFWTSSKYHCQSRSSSRSDLSEHSHVSHASSAMAKSQSEPISIMRTPPVTPYSETDAIPPKKSGILDFSAYLIQKRGPLAQSGIGQEHLLQTSCVQSSVMSSSMHETTSSSSVQTTKCSGVRTVSHMTKTERKAVSHMTQSSSHVTSTNSFHSENVVKTSSDQPQKELVLRVHPTENRVDIKFSDKRDSVVSVPYAKPNKVIKQRHSEGSVLDTLHIPEDEYYFRSNLSDKMSDYEDIWKYADPRTYAQTDMFTRVFPHMTNAPKSPTSLTVKSIEFQANDTFREQVSRNNCVLEDLNVSLDKLDVSKDDTKNQQSKLSQNQIKTCSSSSEGETFRSNEVAFYLSEHKLEPRNQHNIGAEEDTSALKLSHTFDTIHEQESDLDSDSDHDDRRHGDSSGEADTEDCDEQPRKIHTKQTQTSPLWKLKSPALSNGRKSVSTSSLSTMKTPVYSEPFDAISPEDKHKASVQKGLNIKKKRRQSAPVLGMVKTRHPSSECAKLPPFLGEETKSCDEEDKIDNTESDPGHSTGTEDVFEFSLEQKPLKMGSAEKMNGNNGPYETPWVESALFSKCKKISHDTQFVDNGKPKAAPRKPKVGKKPTLIQTAVVNDRNMKLKQNYTSGVVDPIELLGDFDENHNASSPTINKFPVYSSQNADEPIMQHEGSTYFTAEDIITLSNPELALRPNMFMFPPNGPISEYDNLNGPYVAPSMNSQGTVFQEPWEQGMVAKIMTVAPHHSPTHIPMTPPPNHPAPPPLPAIDPTERIVMWQQSSQKYSPCVPSDAENGDIEQCGMNSDILPEEAPTLTQPEKNSVYEFQVSSNGKRSQSHSHSDQTIVNECTSHSETNTEKYMEAIPIVAGTDFREKIAPTLANPRLLHQLTHNRNPDRQIREYIMNLSKDRNTTFGSTIENFIQCTKDSHDSNPHNITRNVRQFMNGIKNYLVKHGEGELEDLIDRERNQLGCDEILNIDAIIEGALHECVIRPLKQCICNLFVQEYTKNGSISLLRANMKYARTKTAEEIGIRKELTPPDGPTLELIKHYFTRMQKSYSPLKKLEFLLSATSSIYKCVSQHHQGNNSPPAFGADDFLPMLIYVLVQCGTIAVEIEADYMWGLLHPSLLTGEGGYYLTSLSSAVLVLKNFKEMQESKASQQQGKLPSISDMQGFLKIAIPDEQRDTIVWPTLPVRPSMTTRDVCSMIAHKFKITNPQDYGLYTLENGEEHKLMDLECPQSLKAERLAYKKECIFVYKRNAANIAWPKSVQ